MSEKDPELSQVGQVADSRQRLEMPSILDRQVLQIQVVTECVEIDLADSELAALKTAAEAVRAKQADVADL